MNRTYFKGKGTSSNREKERFAEFLEGHGADFIEEVDNEIIGVFKIPKQRGNCRAAIALCIDGQFKFGIIRKDCDNFDNGNSVKWERGELPWVFNTIAGFFDWTPAKKKKFKR